MTGELCTNSTCSGISLCNLCGPLCLCGVVYSEFINHRNTEVAQRRARQGLRSCPKGDEGRNQQPEQSFHEEEKESPKTQALDPLGYGHVAIIWRAARDSKMLMIVFANPLRLSGCETAQQQLSNTT